MLKNSYLCTVLLRKTILTVLLLSFSIVGFSAKGDKSADTLKIKKCMVKYNPMGTLMWKSVPLYYEQRMNKVIALSMGAGFIIPHNIKTSKLSFEQDWFSANFNDARVTGYFFTPEIKFYLGGRGPKGFYISRYIRYGKTNMQFTGDFDDHNGNTATVDVSVTLKEYGTGRQFGAQWILGERVMLDFFFLGLRTSEYTLGFEADATVRSEQWEQWQEEHLQSYYDWLDDSRFGFVLEKLPYEFTKNGIKFSYPFTLGNIRHGISIGYRF